MFMDPNWQELKDAGFSAEALHRAGVGLRELWKLGFSLHELKRVGDAKSLGKLGFTLEDLRNAGFTVKDLQPVDHSVPRIWAACVQVCQEDLCVILSTVPQNDCCKDKKMQKMVDK